MDVNTLKDIVKKHPTVWKTTKAWLIRKNDVYDWGLAFRKKLELAYDRKIEDDEDIVKTLQEAERHLSGETLQSN